MTYMEIIKHFPKFLAAKTSLQYDCKNIIFGKEYTAATNGFCLIATDYVSDKPHCEDKNGKMVDIPAETIEIKINKTLNNAKSNIITTCKLDNPRNWLNAFSYLNGECYVYLDKSKANVYQADYDNKKHIQFINLYSISGLSYGGVFNSKWIAEALSLMTKTSPTDDYTLSITNDKYPLLLIQNDSTTYLMTGLRKLHPILADWLDELKLPHCGI